MDHDGPSSKFWRIIPFQVGKFYGIWNQKQAKKKELIYKIHPSFVGSMLHVQFFFRGRIASKQKWRPFNFFGDSPNHGYSGPPFLLRYHRKVIRAKSEVAVFWR